MKRLLLSFSLLILFGAALVCTYAFFITTDFPQMPAVYVDNNELECGYAPFPACYTGSPGLGLTPPSYEFVLGTTFLLSGSMPSYCTTIWGTLSTSTYGANAAGLNNAIKAMEACRTQSLNNSACVSGILDLPPSGNYANSTAPGNLIPQTSTAQATCGLIVRSAAWATLAHMSKPVGAGGLQDNVNAVGVTQIGMDNPDGTGTNMQFANGAQNPSGIITGIYQVSVNTTGLSAITLNASPQFLPLHDGFVSPALDSSTTAGECTVGGQPGILIDPAANVTTTTGPECVQPLPYGGVTEANGAMLNGSAILTDTTDAPFQVGMVGLPIVVQKAGNSTGTSPLTTTVASYQSATQITLISAALSAVSSDSFTVTGNQLGLYGVFTKNHAAGVCALYNVTAAEVALTANTECYNYGNGIGAFTLANSAMTNVSAYNYLRYLPQLVGNYVANHAIYPIVLCNNLSTSSTIHCGGTTTLGPDHWEFQYLAGSLAPGNINPGQYLIETGQNVPAHATSTCTTPPFAESCYTSQAHHIHFNGIFAHGDWTSLQTGSNYIEDVVDFSGCYYCSFTDSQISQALDPGSEGHGIYNGGNAIKLANNWIECCSIGIFAGGMESAVHWYQWEFNTDVQIGRYRVTFPYSWLGMENIPAANPYFSGNPSIVRKNCTEDKVGQRLLYYGGIEENVDGSGGQGGICFASLANASAMPNYSLTDVLVEYMIFRNFNNSFTNSDTRGPSSDGGPTFLQSRFEFSHILGYSISKANPGGPTGNNYGSRIDGGAQSCNALVSQGSGPTSGIVTAQCFASVDQGTKITSATYPSVAMGTGYTDYATPSGAKSAAQNAALCGGSTLEYIFVSGFTPATSHFNSQSYAGFQCVASSASLITLATGNETTTTQTATATGNPVLANTAAAFNAVGNFMTLDMLSGDPAFLTGCSSIFGYNMPIDSSAHNVATGIGPFIITGNTAWGGTYQGYANWTSAMARVTYGGSSSTLDGTQDFNGQCILSNGQGGPPHLIWNHVGEWCPACQESIYPIQTYANGGPPFAHYVANLNSYFVSQPISGSPPTSTDCNGGWDNLSADTTSTVIHDANVGCAEGEATERFTYDVNSLSAVGLWFFGRNYARYSEFQNNANFAQISDGCTTSAGCTPPTDAYTGGTWGFPSTGNCTGSSTTAYTGPGTGCGGFTGIMSQSTMPLTLADYHGFTLRSDSPMYHASPDGSGDIGPNIAMIDTYQTLNQFVDPVCGTACPGPFPDSLTGGAPPPPGSTPVALTPKAFAKLDNYKELFKAVLLSLSQINAFPPLLN